MIRTDAMIIGGILLGIYLFRDKIGTAFNPASSQNVVNQTAETLYQSVTGSKGTPGGDAATYIYTQLDTNSISVLEDYFTKQGVTDMSIARAKDLGWSDSDIAKATFWMSRTDW